MVFFSGVCSQFSLFPDLLKQWEGAVAQSVELATPGEGVLGSIAAVAALSLLVESVSV